MPNWCFNRLQISSEDVNSIKAFKMRAKTKDTDLSLNNLYPMPKELKDTSSPSTVVSDKDYQKEIAKIREENKNNKALERSLPITKSMQDNLIAKYGTDNWYDWQVQKWGTKWDVTAELVSDDEGFLEYEFDSAWSPPTAWLEKVAKDYPLLQFMLKYEEEGVGFMGRAKAHGNSFDDQTINT